MSEVTNIEWATSTGNPWIGCTKVSPGCKNCYAAELDAHRFSKTMGGGTKEQPESHWGKGAPRVRTKGFWKDAVKWNTRVVCALCGELVDWEHRHGSIIPAFQRPRIFPSMCDWLDEEVPIEWLADFLQLMFECQNLDWLLLTKRPENFEGRLFKIWDDDYCKFGARPWIKEWIDGRPPANVWVGVSVEDQKRADERIPLLLQIPAKVRFLSVEPLLEPVDLTQCCADEAMGVTYNALTGKNWSEAPLPKIDWVIVGGESGPARRDCGVAAIEEVAAQCQGAGVPVFVKQDCALKPGQRGRLSEEVWRLKQFPPSSLGSFDAASGGN